ncbi:MAG TPA: SDR family NAD(P)-dependent oxidoreductase, partial [Vicinamibacterales bacterium]
MFALTGRVAVVTGASRGIGRAIATRLAGQGAVVCAAARHENARDTAEAIVAAGGRGEAYTVDVTDASSVEALVTAVIERHGRVDILVNNAGIARDQLMLR